MDVFELQKQKISGLSRRMREGELSAARVTEAFLAQIGRENARIRAFITVDREGALRRAEELDRLPLSERRGRLFGIPVSVKDNLLTKGLRTTAGSAFLENYIPVDDAEAVARLRAEGAVILGKTNLDEFGMGSRTANPVFGNTEDPREACRSMGGSSGGAAASVLAGMCMAALGTDTGGSVRQPAAYAGLYGIKPGYGTVSRYGLISYASSMDQVGAIARSPEDLGIILSVIAGRDPKDDTSLTLPEGFREALAAAAEDMGEAAVLRGLRIGVPEAFLEDGKLSAEVHDAVEQFSAFAEAHGASVSRFSMKDTALHVPVYYMLAACEASSNLGRYDGIRYGTDRGTDGTLTSLYTGNRTAGFSAEVRRRILMGTYILSEEHYTELYLKAERVRERIRQAYREAFTQYDLLLMPAVRGKAPLLSEELVYEDDLFTVGVNLAGLPGIALPSKDASVQLVSGQFGERLLLQAAAAYERGGAGR